VAAQEGAQLLDFGVAGGVGVHANRPHPIRLFERRPKLLRNPGEARARERKSRQPVGQRRNAFRPQRGQRVSIESVARRNPDFRSEAVSAKNFEAGSYPFALRAWVGAGELRDAMQRQQAGAAAGAEMAIAVQADCGSHGFHNPHLFPEL